MLENLFRDHKNSPIMKRLPRLKLPLLPSSERGRRVRGTPPQTPTRNSDTSSWGELPDSGRSACDGWWSVAGEWRVSGCQGNCSWWSGRSLSGWRLLGAVPVAR